MFLISGRQFLPMPPILTNTPTITPVTAPTTINRIPPTATTSSSVANRSTTTASTVPSAPTLTNNPLILNTTFPATNKDNNKNNIDKAQLNQDTSPSSYYRGCHYLPPNEGDNTDPSSRIHTHNQYKFISAPTNVSSPASQVLSLKEYMRQHGLGKHAPPSDSNIRSTSNATGTITSATNNRVNNLPTTKMTTDDKSHIRNRLNIESSNYDSSGKENTATTIIDASSQNRPVATSYNNKSSSSSSSSSGTSKIDDYLENYKKSRPIDHSTRATEGLDYKLDKFSHLESDRISNYLDEKNITAALDNELSMTGSLGVEDYNVLEREVEAAAIDSRKKVAAAAANLDREMAELLQSYIRVTNDHETESDIPPPLSIKDQPRNPTVIRNRLDDN